MKLRKKLLTVFLVCAVTAVSGSQSDCGTEPCSAAGSSCQVNADCCNGSCYLGAGGRRCVD